MGSQTSLKTSQRGGCNPLNPPPGSASALHACFKGKSIVKMYMYCINENLTPTLRFHFFGLNL